MAACDQRPGPPDLKTPEGVLRGVYEVVMKVDGGVPLNLLAGDASRRFGTERAIGALRGMLAGYEPVPGKARAVERVRHVSQSMHDGEYAMDFYSIDVAGKRNGVVSPLVNVGVQCAFDDASHDQYFYCWINRIVPAACRHWSSAKTLFSTLEKSLAAGDREQFKNVVPVPREDGYDSRPQFDELKRYLGDLVQLQPREPLSGDGAHLWGDSYSIRLDIQGRYGPHDPAFSAYEDATITCRYAPEDVCTADCRLDSLGNPVR